MRPSPTWPGISVRRCDHPWLVGDLEPCLLVSDGPCFSPTGMFSKSQQRGKARPSVLSTSARAHLARTCPFRVKNPEPHYVQPDDDERALHVSLQIRAPPAPVIATRDDLLAVALAPDVVTLYRSRLPRDPHALSKPLELQVGARCPFEGTFMLADAASHLLTVIMRVCRSMRGRCAWRCSCWSWPGTWRGPAWRRGSAGAVLLMPVCVPCLAARWAARQACQATRCQHRCLAESQQLLRICYRPSNLQRCLVATTWTHMAEAKGSERRLLCQMDQDQRQQRSDLSSRTSRCSRISWRLCWAHQGAAAKAGQVAIELIQTGSLTRD